MSASFSVAYDDTVSRRKCQTSKGTYKADLRNFGELSGNKLLWAQENEQSIYSTSSVIQFT